MSLRECAGLPLPSVNYQHHNLVHIHLFGVLDYKMLSIKKDACITKHLADIV